jgi:hypothetical protein
MPPQPSSAPPIGDGELVGSEEEDLVYLPDEGVIPPPDGLSADDQPDEGSEGGDEGSVSNKLDYSDLLVDGGSEFDSDLIYEDDIIEPI